MMHVIPTPQRIAGPRAFPPTFNPSTTNPVLILLPPVVLLPTPVHSSAAPTLPCSAVVLAPTTSTRHVDDDPPLPVCWMMHMCVSYILSLKLFPTAVKNSVINTVAAVVISVSVSTLSAYGFARIWFPGREGLFKLYLFTLMVPGFLNIIPQFVVLGNVKFPGMENGLVGTRLGLILVYVATNVCGHTFFLRNFFAGLPNSLAESVIIDGGGHGTIFFRIMLPLSKPAIGTMCIFALQGFWEEYFTAKVLVGANEKMITLPLLLQRLYGEHTTRWEWVFAASILTLIPVIILFVIAQKKIGSWRFDGRSRKRITIGGTHEIDNRIE